MLKIYNTLTRQKETFHPIEDGKVRMYVCGMTVYDYCHLGHARVMVVFDVVARYLRCLNYDLIYVRNVTDIDDKIIKRAHENDEPFTELTRRFIAAMHEDEQALNVLPPDIEPHASESMDTIIGMIQKLLDHDYAYIGANGDVYYAVSKFTHYGQLSGRNLTELQAGERVEIDRAKKDPLDFVLWKMAKPGEPSWASPWGQGRPGWHIECSAMSTNCLGNHFDIHGGGMDLQFPHHDNEIAQSEGATGEKFVNIWMHNGFVRVDEEKMSKSLNNFFTVREVMKRYRPEVIRLFILASHYRSPLNYSDEQLDEASAALTRLYTALRGINPGSESAAGASYRERFAAAMSDDFNTAIALSVLFDLAREINRQKSVDQKTTSTLAATLKILADVLGLLGDDAEEHFKGPVRSIPTAQTATNSHAPTAEVAAGLSNSEIERLIEERLSARKNKDWATADRIRDVLKAKGIVLEDSAGMTTWRRE